MLEQFFTALHQLLAAIPLSAIGRALVQTEFNAIWCAGTLLYFTSCLILLVRRAWPIRRALNRLVRSLRGVSDPDAFARRFESYTQLVHSEKFLRHAWHEFDESLIKPRENESTRVRNTQEPSAYFNDTSIVQPVVHTRFFDTVPSHLVGLGILGTFLGLAAGVGIAQEGLTGNPEEVTKSLRILLSGASLAFVTSIFGLGLSLLFLWIERTLVGSVHRQLSAWVEKLEACVELVTPEQIALEQLEQEKRQTKQLERFNDQLVFALEKALDEKVAQRLVPELERVVQAIDSLRADRADTNMSAMQRLVEEFSNRLTQSTGREMEAMGSTLRDVGDRLQVLVTAMQESGAQFQRTGQSTAEGIADSLASFAESVARFDRGTTAQSELASRIVELTNGLRGAGDVILQAHRGFAESLEPVREMTRSLDSTGARLTEALEATSQLVEESTNAVRSLHEENETIAAVWQSYEERFGGIDQSLTNVFQQLDMGLQRYAEKVRDYLIEVDAEVSKAIQSLTAAIGELQETMEDQTDRPPERR